MTEPLLRLLPQPTAEVALDRLYLQEDLQQSGANERPFVYTNYVCSLDGRISVTAGADGAQTVPHAIANPRDWRLFQELAAQADVLITSGRHLRERAAGTAQEIIAVYDDPSFADLRAWRVHQGLSAYPALAVVSASLNCPIPAEMRDGQRDVVFFTSARAQAARVAEIQAQGFTVIQEPGERVTGATLIDRLGTRGYRCIYSVTGPEIMHMLLADQCLDRLYLTVVHRLLGGTDYRSLVEGSLLAPPTTMRLRSLYYDPAAPEGVGQSFASFERWLPGN